MDLNKGMQLCKDRVLGFKVDDLKCVNVYDMKLITTGKKTYCTVRS